MTETLVYLDDTPGELRGVIYRDGFQHILIHTEGEDEQERLGARSVGRVDRVEPVLGGVFVDLGGAARNAFLPTTGGQRLNVGEKVEVEVVSEPREAKGVTLKRLGVAEGEPRLLAPGPTVPEWLERLAPGAKPVGGRDAIEAGWSAVEEAMSQPSPGDGEPRVTVERTRAMITADIDYSPSPGERVTPWRRTDLNRRGLQSTARTVRLRRLGGLVAIDLLGQGHHGDELLKTARAAFGQDPAIVYGPVNRFGVMMLSLPWRFRPLAETMGPAQAAVEAARRLNHALLSDTTTPRVTLRLHPEIVRLASPLVARLGPRAHLKGDENLRPGEHALESD